MKLEKITNSIKKMPKVLGLAAGLSLGLYSAEAQTQERKIDYYIKIEGAENVESNKLKIIDVPEEIRNVPAHPDDARFVIADMLPNKGVSGLKAEPYIASLRLGAEFSNRFVVGGIIQTRSSEELYAPGAGEDWDDKEYITRRGYIGGANSKRVTGTAFTYFGQLRIKTDKRNLLKGVFARANLLERYASSLRLEYDYFPRLNLQIDNGWDRYNHFEINKTHDLGKIDMHKLFLEFNFGTRNFPLEIGFYMGAGTFGGLKKNEEFTKPGDFKMDVGKPFLFGGMSASLHLPARINKL